MGRLMLQNICQMTFDQVEHLDQVNWTDQTKVFTRNDVDYNEFKF